MGSTAATVQADLNAIGANVAVYSANPAVAPSPYVITFLSSSENLGQTPLTVGPNTAGTYTLTSATIGYNNLVFNNFDSGVTEVQDLTFSGAPTGGTYQLIFGSKTTGAITYTTTASNEITNIQNALSTAGVGTVTVTGSAPTYAIAFTSPSSGVALGTLTNNALTGGTSPSATLSLNVTSASIQAAGTSNFLGGAAVYSTLNTSADLATITTTTLPLGISTSTVYSISRFTNYDTNINDPYSSSSTGVYKLVGTQPNQAFTLTLSSQTVNALVITGNNTTLTTSQLGATMVVGSGAANSVSEVLGLMPTWPAPPP